MAEDIQQQLAEFEKSRNSLMSISAQKQQLQFQAGTMGQSLEELGKTKEKKVLKVVGNILVQADAEKVKKEIEEKKESVELRVKALQKQEDSLVNRMNKLKAEIEKAQPQPAEQETITEKDMAEKY